MKMAKKIQDLKPDIILKNYWNDKEQFTDLFNAVLFHGKQVIQAEELEDIDTEESNILEHREYAESIKASRDIIKIEKRAAVHGVQLVLFGLENQEHIHYAMPMRIMGYDYGSYKKQYDSNARQYKSAVGMEEDEFLSRMKKTDRFTPVITIVIYYGEKVWDGATSLHEMLQIPEEMKPYVNDYKMLLVEARESKLTLHHINNQDLFQLLEIVLDRNIPRNEAKQKAIEYSREHKVDKTVIMTVAGAANMKLDYNVLAQRGEVNMCTLFEEERLQGIKEGEIKGEIKGEAKGIIKMGYEFGLSESDILERLQKSLNISLQMAQEYLKMFGKQTV